MPTVPLRPVAWCALAVLVLPLLRAGDADPTVVARQALAALEQGRQYAWEFRDLDGEVENKTIWVENPTAQAMADPAAKPSVATIRKRRLRTLSPTVQGQHRTDGWAVIEAGFSDGPKILAVLHPSGARVIQSRKGDWLPVGKFRTEFGPDPSRLTELKEQKTYSAAWAALTSPVPHLLLSLLLHDASHFRFGQDEIIADVSVASARQLLGPDSSARKLAPERFKGSARLRVRDGILRECQIQLDYDVDLTGKETPSNENIDVLILFRGPLTEVVAVPEAARAQFPAE